jgi:hypothetical protein
LEPRAAVPARRSEPAVENQAAPIAAFQTPAAERAPAPAEPPVLQHPAPVAEATSGWDSTIAHEPAATFREFIVPADSVVGIQMESTITSETAKVEDRVEALVVRDVRVGGETAIPAGSRTIGSVTAVERGGKFKERGRLGIRFHTLVLADGTEMPITTETIYRYGDAPGKSSATKVGGGAAAGAILGAILGGSKGAVVGASTGAGAGAAVVVAGDRSEATFTSGTELTARILAPVTITVEN